MQGRDIQKEPSCLVELRGQSLELRGDRVASIYGQKYWKLQGEFQKGPLQILAKHWSTHLCEETNQEKKHSDKVGRTITKTHNVCSHQPKGRSPNTWDIRYIPQLDIASVMGTNQP